MEILSKLVYAVMLLSAIGVVVLVLLQHGKGADMGTGFGAGASGSLFGATGSANFLSRFTAILAACFFVSTLTLSYFANSRTHAAPAGGDVLPSQLAPVAPAAPPAGAGNTVPASPATTGTQPQAPAGGGIPK